MDIVDSQMYEYLVGFFPVLAMAREPLVLVLNPVDPVTDTDSFANAAALPLLRRQPPSVASVGCGFAGLHTAYLLSKRG